MFEPTDRTAENRGVRELSDNTPFNVDDLSHYLVRQVPEFSGIQKIQAFKGGQSNPTYLIHDENRAYVLRKKPPGKLLPSAHAVEREYRIMKALGQTDVPVPEMYLLCEDRTVVGTEFYLMEYADGRIFWQATLEELPKEERRQYYDVLTQTLAALHQVDFESLGLSDYGKSGNYFARQIGRWSKQYVASELQPIPEMHQLIEWLPKNIPEGDETSVVHGDYRLDNVVFHKTEPKIIAVLDWELSTLGHPLGDFSYYCMNWRLPTGLGGQNVEELNLPSEQETIQQYCRHTGRDDIESWDFYMVYNLFRAAAILQGVAARAEQGNASNKQAKAMGARAKPIAEYAWSLVEK